MKLKRISKKDLLPVMEEVEYSVIYENKNKYLKYILDIVNENYREYLIYEDNKIVGFKGDIANSGIGNISTMFLNYCKENGVRPFYFPKTLISQNVIDITYDEDFKVFSFINIELTFEGNVEDISTMLDNCYLNTFKYFKDYNIELKFNLEVERSYIFANRFHIYSHKSDFYNRGANPFQTELKIYNNAPFIMLDDSKTTYDSIIIADDKNKKFLEYVFKNTLRLNISTTSGAGDNKNNIIDTVIEYMYKGYSFNYNRILDFVSFKYNFNDIKSNSKSISDYNISKPNKKGFKAEEYIYISTDRIGDIMNISQLCSCGNFETIVDSKIEIDTTSVSSDILDYDYTCSKCGKEVKINQGERKYILDQILRSSNFELIFLTHENEIISKGLKVADPLEETSMDTIHSKNEGSITMFYEYEKGEEELELNAYITIPYIVDKDPSNIRFKDMMHFYTSRFNGKNFEYYVVHKDNPLVFNYGYNGSDLDYDLLKIISIDKYDNMVNNVLLPIQRYTVSNVPIILNFKGLPYNIEETESYFKEYIDKYNVYDYYLAAEGVVGLEGKLSGMAMIEGSFASILKASPGIEMLLKSKEYKSIGLDIISNGYRNNELNRFLDMDEGNPKSILRLNNRKVNIYNQLMDDLALYEMDVSMVYILENLISIVGDDDIDPEIVAFYYLADVNSRGDSNIIPNIRKAIRGIEAIDLSFKVDYRDVLKYLMERTEEFPKEGYNINFVVGRYYDYLDMITRYIEDDSINENVLFPKNLIREHDAAAVVVSDIVDNEYEHKFNDVMKDLDVEYKDDEVGLMVVKPEVQADLVKEGVELNHCVGSYVRSVAEEKCVVVFVRDIHDPDKSLYTLELNNLKGERIIRKLQFRGKYNSEPSEEAKKFVNDYIRYMNKKIFA